jgi:hypothetical protein
MTGPRVQRDDGLDENDRDVLADMGHLRLPYVVDHEPEEGVDEDPGD